MPSPNTLCLICQFSARRHQGNVRVRIAGLEVASIHDETTPVRSYCLDQPQELPASLEKIAMVLDADANPVFLAMIGAFPESGRDNSRTCTNVTPGPRPFMESFSSLLNEYALSAVFSAERGAAADRGNNATLATKSLRVSIVRLWHCGRDWERCAVRLRCPRRVGRIVALPALRFGELLGA